MPIKCGREAKLVKVESHLLLIPVFGPITLLLLMHGKVIGSLRRRVGMALIVQYQKIKGTVMERMLPELF